MPTHGVARVRHRLRAWSNQGDREHVRDHEAPPPHRAPGPRQRRAAPGDLGRGARPRRRRASAASVDRHGPRTFGMFSCSKATNEVNYIAQKFIRAAVGQQQHRQLQPNLTRPQRRRSGDGLRSRRRDELLPRGGGDGRHPPLGIERARDAPDLLPPRAQGDPPRRQALRRSTRAAPRSAAWADGWLPLEVGTDIALANGVARVILERGLRAPGVHRARDRRASTPTRELGRALRPSSAPSASTGVAADAHRADGARLRARRPRHDLLDARHHRAPQRGRQRARADQPRRSSPGTSAAGARGSTRCAARTTCRAAATWARCRNKLPGFQDVEDAAPRAQVRARLGRQHPAEERLAPHRDVRGDGPRRAHRALRHRREPRPVRGRRRHTRSSGSRGLECLVVQDIFLTSTAELADVVLPGVGELVRGRGDGDQQRAAGAARAARRSPPPGRRATTSPSSATSRAGSGYDLGDPTPEAAWDELRTLSPMHAGMSYARLEALGGLQWPCPDEDHPGSPFLHGRLWEEPVRGPARALLRRRARGPGRRARRRLPAAAHHRPPARLVQHRRADRAATPRRSRRGETLDLSPGRRARGSACATASWCG